MLARSLSKTVKRNMAEMGVKSTIENGRKVPTRFSKKDASIRGFVNGQWLGLLLELAQVAQAYLREL